MLNKRGKTMKKNEIELSNVKKTTFHKDNIVVQVNTEKFQIAPDNLQFESENDMEAISIIVPLAEASRCINKIFARKLAKKTSEMKLQARGLDESILFNYKIMTFEVRFIDEENVEIIFYGYPAKNNLKEEKCIG